MSEADGLMRLRLPIAVTYNWSAGPNATSHLAGLWIPYPPSESGSHHGPHDF